MTSERQLLDALVARYSATYGAGDRYVVAEHVRSHTGFDARRTCDFMAADLWPSQLLALHGHEVKTSRADWLRELHDPTKAAEFMRVCDFWWLVSPPGITRPGELPAGWGHLELIGATLRVRVPAPQLAHRDARRDEWWLSRDLAFCLLRSAVRTARATPVEDLALSV